VRTILLAPLKLREASESENQSTALTRIVPLLATGLKSHELAAPAPSESDMQSKLEDSGSLGCARDDTKEKKCGEES
jgi:hypothetical protein